MSIIASRPNTSNRTVFYTEDRACEALRREMEALNYGEITIREVLPFCHDEGTLATPIELGMIDLEDAERLTEAFVSGFDPVRPSSPEWDDAGTWWPTAPTAEDSRQYAALAGDYDADDAPLGPPAGVEPDDRDWDSWAEWSASLDPADRYEEAELAEVGVSGRSFTR
jgi:hypothetical protein